MPPEKTYADQGTPELSKRREVRPELVSQSTGLQTHLRVLDQTELDRLLLRDAITPEEYRVADTFARDAYLAGLTGVKASNYERTMGTGGPSSMSDDEALRRVNVHKTMDAIDKKHGKLATSMVYDVCVSSLPLKPAALDLFKKILVILRNHYAARLVEN